MCATLGTLGASKARGSKVVEDGHSSFWFIIIIFYYYYFLLSLLLFFSFLMIVKMSKLPVVEVCVQVQEKTVIQCR